MFFKTSVHKKIRNIHKKTPELESFFKPRLSPSKKFVFIYFNESPLKMVKNAFYFILKAHFVLEIFPFLS